MVQRDAGTEEEEDNIDQVPMATNLDENRLSPSVAIGWFALGTGPNYRVIPAILEEEVANVKDSITSRLPFQEKNVGGGASGSGGMPTWSTIGKFGVHKREGGKDAEEDKKLVVMANKTEEKGKMTIDSMVESLW